VPEYVECLGVVNHANLVISIMPMSKAQRLQKHPIDLAQKTKECGPFDNAERIKLYVEVRRFSRREPVLHLQR